MKKISLLKLEKNVVCYTFNNLTVINLKYTVLVSTVLEALQ